MSVCLKLIIYIDVLHALLCTNGALRGLRYCLGNRCKHLRNKCLNSLWEVVRDEAKDGRTVSDRHDNN